MEIRSFPSGPGTTSKVNPVAPFLASSASFTGWQASTPRSFLRHLKKAGNRSSPITFRALAGFIRCRKIPIRSTPGKQIRSAPELFR